MDSETLYMILELGNLILSSANVIIGLSLLLYILTHNLRSPVARAFCALMAFVSVVYLVDVSITEVSSLEVANVWLRLQWLGISFVPAAYFHFSDALLRTTGAISRWRRMGVIASYVLGLVAFLMAAFGSFIVQDIAQKDYIYHLVAGPGFWLFAAYYALTTLSGWGNISRARGRCLTSTSRRRMSYLMLAFAAPGVGVFPYLLIPTAPAFLSANAVALLTLIGDIGIALMTVVIGYIVAYQGVLLPDRVIKHSLMHFLLRGPLVAILVIGLMMVIPRVEHILGLPRDTILIVSVAGSIVILQLLINKAKPAIDRLIYSRDRTEINWIQRLDQRLLTTRDLEQLLENTVIALCDLLRAPSGFIVTMQDSAPAIRVFCGPREAATYFLARTSLPQLLNELSDRRCDEFIASSDFTLADGHWALPLRSHREQRTLGLLGIAVNGRTLQLSDEDLETIYGLVRRAELGLEDMRLQQQVFAVLQNLDQELDEIQSWGSHTLYSGDGALQHFELNPINAAGYTQIVKDALSQLWGGPKLNQSPLLRMQVVRDQLSAHDNVPAKALRAVLTEAIERLRPDGEQNLTSTEWILYNILDLRFLQGYKIRDIVSRLAMSESDFYRKQRIAIEQVALTLGDMERHNHSHSAAADPE